MQPQILNSAEALPESGWQRLATGNDPFMSRAFLGAAESTGAAPAVSKSL